MDTRRMKSQQAEGRWTIEALSGAVTRWTGGTTALMMAAGAIALWLVTGPVFGYSDTWQLAINTGTTIITFLMVFLIQRSQNKDGLAIQLKLDELVAAFDGASNRLINVEGLSEDELRHLQGVYSTLAKRAAREPATTASRSVDDPHVHDG
jgi:low affinity Fe/Cu permease